MFADFVALEMFPVLLFFISFFGLTSSSNIIKSIVFIVLMQTSAVMIWMIFGGYFGTNPPIDVQYVDLNTVADPLPQALMLTAIIIGISLTAINITMFNTLFRRYKTANWIKLEELVAEEFMKRTLKEEADVSKRDNCGNN